MFVVEGIRLVEEALSHSELASALYLPEHLSATARGRALLDRLEHLPGAAPTTWRGAVCRHGSRSGNSAPRSGAVSAGRVFEGEIVVRPALVSVARWFGDSSRSGSSHSRLGTITTPW